jgi:hypothetical protein
MERNKNMSIEDVIHAWKADAEALEPHLPTSPVGHEISEEELLEVSGGCIYSCGQGGSTCTVTCLTTCDITASPTSVTQP